jgi:hypothetical protein
MRDFATIERDLKLDRFIASELGTLYVADDDRGVPKLMVRRFDGDASPSLIKPYVGIVRGCQDWVDGHGLAGQVRIEQPAEVGVDFVARPYHIYTTSLWSYDEDSHPPEPPPELAPMRRKLRQAMGGSSDPRDAILERVLARSLLEPSGKTIFKTREDRFLVVEPKIDRADVEEWANLG